MAINSRRKGNVAERTVCKILKAAFGGEPWERKSMGIPGPDLLTPDSFAFAVEIKHDKRIKCLHLFAKPTNVIRDFWKQASAQADSLDKFPLLIVKAEGVFFATTDGEAWRTLEDWCLDVREAMK